MRRFPATLAVAVAVLALLGGLAGPDAAHAARRSQLAVASSGGVHDLSRADLRRELDVARAVGARWFRFDMNWAVVQARGPTSWNWAPFDRVVRAARARGLRVVGTIWYTPAWARPAGTPAWHPPSRIRTFARFAAAAARRYKRLRVHHWEIWNEPNIPHAWAGRPSPRAYARLLAVASRRIHRADRKAFVISAGLSPARSDGTSIAPIRFLRGLYRAGVRRSFNAVGHHASTFPAFPGARLAWSAWYQMAGTRPSLRSVMIAHGDRRKKIWITEFGAPTGGNRAVSESTQAAMLRRGYNVIARHRWAGPLFWYSIRDRGGSDWQSSCGLVRRDFSRKPAFSAYRRLAARAS